MTTRNQLSMDIFYPQIDLKKGCYKCQACIKACPAEALVWEGGAPILKKDLCQAYILTQDECFECIMSCRRGLIRMIKKTKK